MAKEPLKYGCVVEDEFSLRSPRMIDGDEQDTLSDAMEEAVRLIRDGASQLSIVRCRFSARAEAWVEKVGAGSIQIDARDCEWAHEDEDSEPGETSS